MMLVGLLEESSGVRYLEGGTYHAVAGKLGIGLQNAVCGGVVASGIHGI